MGAEPKFRPECECGARAPRWTTAWTAEKWMRRHAEEHQGETA